VAAGALEQGAAEEALYAAAERNGLVGDDGQRPTWATSRSGPGAGLQQSIDLDADDRPPGTRRSKRTRERWATRRAGSPGGAAPDGRHLGHDRDRFRGAPALR
jgi:hypothetical protein